MKFQPLKGMRDLGTSEAMKKQGTIAVIRSVFEKYGFSPVETPALESFEMLSMKGGGDAIRREIYNFKDQGGREIGLRFDLTVPLARFVSNNPTMPKPFKRYAIGDVWRYDNPQASRWRQFTQADVDTIGSSSIMADVECVAAIIDALESVGLKDFKIRVNNRKLLENILAACGVKKDKISEVFRTIDRMDKIGKAGVGEKLKKIGVDEEKIFSYLDKKFAELGKIQGYGELEEFLAAMDNFGMAGKIKTDLTLVRGLEYYTGNVFEVVSSLSVSIGGGGRYDKMMAAYGAGYMPAVGMSIGVDRLLELLPNDDKKTPSTVFVAVIGNVAKEASQIANNLRKNGVATSIELAGRNIKKQLEYADSLKIPFVVILGPEEVESKTAKVRNMETRKEENLKLEELDSYLIKLFDTSSKAVDKR
ncbi:MAG: histidine--tRNA ligase [Candidatus Aenigmarchaeota archaeon]|nr:histidine--tRNA ligase [Candidatus Aenigmarchaeota archaeon]